MSGQGICDSYKKAGRDQREVSRQSGTKHSRTASNEQVYDISNKKEFIKEAVRVAYSNQKEDNKLRSSVKKVEPLQTMDDDKSPYRNTEKQMKESPRNAELSLKKQVSSQKSLAKNPQFYKTGGFS